MLKVLEVALGEIGYKEGAGNRTKYAEHMDSLVNFYNGKKNGYAWCDIFVDYCFVSAYGRELAQKLLYQPNNSAGAGCTYSARYFRNNGRFSSTPQVGAQIFFGNAAESYHTGLVYAFDAAKVYTIEGNTSDMVAKREYARTDGNIYGYGIPDYSMVGETATSVSSQVTPTVPASTTVSNSKQCSVTLPEVKYGDKNDAVKAVQTLLVLRKHSVGSYGVDGDFGNATKAAVVAFQRASNLSADGIVGANTWKKLIACI